MIAAQLFWGVRLVLFFGTLVVWVVWVQSLPLSLAAFVSVVAAVLAAVLLARPVGGRDVVMVASLAAIYAIVAGVLR